MKQSALRRLDLCRHSAGVRESCGMSPLPAPVTHSCSAPCHCDAFLCSHQTKFNPSIYSNFCAIDFQEPAFPRLTPGEWHQPSACQPQVLPAPRRTDFLYRSLSLPVLTFLSPCCELFAWQRRTRQSLTLPFACCVHLGSNNTYLKTWGCSMHSPRNHISQIFSQKRSCDWSDSDQYLSQWGSLLHLACTRHIFQPVRLCSYWDIFILLEVSEVSMK